MNIFINIWISISLLCCLFLQTAAAQTHTLQVEKTGDGSGRVRDCQSADTCFGEQIDCGEQCLAVFFDNESVLLKALPDENSLFAGWLVNNQAPVSQDIEMTQDVTVTVTFVRKTDLDPPIVTVNLDQDALLLGESVMITTTAADNTGVVEFQLAVNGEHIADTPGSVSYTPTEIGAYFVTAVASDASGNTAEAVMTGYVRGDMMTVPLFEGVDMERGLSHRDINTLIFMPGDMNAVRTILLPPGPEPFAFPPEADCYFTYREREIVIVPTASAAIAVLQDTAYDTVDASAISSAAFINEPAGVIMTTADTVLIKTTEENYAKIGNFQINGTEWTIQFSSAFLSP